MFVVVAADRKAQDNELICFCRFREADSFVIFIVVVVIV